MTSPKTLILLRHGKSGYPAGVADHERPLAERGWREAGLAGEWLRGAGVHVDQVLCSTARRTREMLASARRRGSNAACTARATSRSSAVSGMPETAQALHELTGKPPSPALEALLVKYSTSALTRIDVAGSWARLAVSGGEVVAFHVPRG